MNAFDWIASLFRAQPQQDAQKCAPLPPRVAVVRKVTPDNVLRHQVVSNVGSEGS